MNSTSTINMVSVLGSRSGASKASKAMVSVSGSGSRASKASKAMVSVSGSGSRASKASKATVASSKIHIFFNKDDESAVKNVGSKVSSETMSGSERIVNNAGGDTREPEDEREFDGAEIRDQTDPSNLLASVHGSSANVEVLHDSLLKLLENQTKKDTVKTSSTRADPSIRHTGSVELTAGTANQDAKNDPPTLESTNKLSRNDTIEMGNIEVELPEQLAKIGSVDKGNSSIRIIPRGRRRSRSCKRRGVSRSKSKSRTIDSKKKELNTKPRQTVQEEPRMKHNEIRQKLKETKETLQVKRQRKPVIKKTPNTPTGPKSLSSKTGWKSPKNADAHGTTTVNSVRGSHPSKPTKTHQQVARASPRNQSLRGGHNTESKGKYLVGSVLQSFRRNGAGKKPERRGSTPHIKGEKLPAYKAGTVSRDSRGNRPLSKTRGGKGAIRRGRSKSRSKKAMRLQPQSRKKMPVQRTKQGNNEKHKQKKLDAEEKAVEKEVGTNPTEADDSISNPPNDVEHAIENRDEGPWLPALTESWATPWHRKVQQSTTMADLEDQRLGDVDIPPDRFVKLTRLEAASDNCQSKTAYFEPVDPELLGSLTDSVSFALSTERRGKTDSASDWDEVVPKMNAPTSHGRGDGWRQIVEASDVLARYGYYEKRGDYSLKKNEKVASAHKIMRRHAARLNLKERDLYSALREDPSFFLSAASFESRSSLALLWDHAIGSLYNVMGYDRN